MRILTLDNRHYDLDHLPEEVDDMRFAKRHLTKRKAFYREANYPFTQEKLDWMKVA